MNTLHNNPLKVVSKTANPATTTTVNNLKKVFTAADLWNIHRHGRTMFDRRNRA
ncbi:hypothetical protein ACQ33O_04105 [Ferruginibacter sp. SUN002]|uniref:hypothetical protein n=1 Tax=Ferruginibacter sp. SUN002 TaxID=2937789 RepID=UPI003D36B5E1